MTVGGIVLCGGHSTRMGQPKAWLPLGGEPLLARVVRLLQLTVQPVIVVAAPLQALPPLPAEVHVVRDSVAEEGPLRGLATGLAALGGTCSAAYVTACDSPFLQAAFVQKLTDLLGSHDAVVPQSEGRPHPLASLYRCSVLPVALRLLHQGHRRLLDLLARITVRYATSEELTAADPQLLSMENLNTPEDYQRAVRKLACPASPC